MGNKGISGIVAVAALIGAALIVAVNQRHPVGKSVMSQSLVQPSASESTATAKSVDSGSKFDCNISTEDFTNREVDSMQFGRIAFQKGVYFQNDELGKADWKFTLTKGSFISKFGPDTVRIVGIAADHMSGSGYWYLEIGYVCSADIAKKVIEISSLAPIGITRISDSSLQFTVWRTYEGANPPRGMKVVNAAWNRENKLFMITESN